MMQNDFFKGLLSHKHPQTDNLSPNPQNTSFKVRVANTDPAPVVTSYLGYLYNFYAAGNVLNIAAAGWHLPTDADWMALGQYLGDVPYISSISGTKLREAGTAHWYAPNTANNSSGFTALPGGNRQNGVFSWAKCAAFFWTANETPQVPPQVFIKILYVNNVALSNSNVVKTQGNSIRLIKDATTLIDGQTGTYVGNDGTIYPTICIGTQEWLSVNLAETKYRDGSDIPIVEDKTAWLALATGARCAFNNDSANAVTTVTEGGTLYNEAIINPQDVLEIEEGANIELSLTGKKLKILSPNKDNALFNPLSGVIDTATYDAYGFIDRLCSGKLVVVYSQGASHADPNAQVVMRTSEDEGKTWSAIQVLCSNSAVGGGGVTSKGRLIVHTVLLTGTDIGSIYSDDEGVTWSNFVAHSFPGHDGHKMTHGRTIKIANDTLIQGVFIELSPTDGHYELHAIFSTDNGQTWGGAVEIYSGMLRLTELSCAYLGGGVIICIVREDILASNDENRPPYQFISLDNGQTWTNQGAANFGAGSVVSPWLEVVRAGDAPPVVVCYYGNRKEYKLYYQTATAYELINSSQCWEERVFIAAPTWSGANILAYPSVLHPDGSPVGYGFWGDNYSLYNVKMTFFRPDIYIIPDNVKINGALTVKEGLKNWGNPANGYKLNGTTGFLSIPNALQGGNLDFGAGNFTIRIFFKTGATIPDGMLIWNSTTYAHAPYYTLYLGSTGTLTAVVADGAGSVNVAGAGIEPNTLYQVDVTIDRAGDMSLYLNSRLINSATMAALVGDLSPLGVFCVGNQFDRSFFNDQIYMVQVFSSALSQEEITLYYNNGRPDLAGLVYSAGCVLDLHPNEIYPTAWIDRSTNNMHATVNGGAVLIMATPVIRNSSVNTQTGTTYTFKLEDSGRLVTFGNAAPIAATIPTNAVVPFPIGTQIDCVQTLAGKVTFGGAGVTINSEGGNKSIAAQWVAVSAIKTDTDTWVLIGDLTA